MVVEIGEKSFTENSDAIKEELHKLLKVSSCFQCRRCTNGCPVTFAMDLYPDEVIRRVAMGQLDRVMKCSTIWICSSCETCTTRCPNEVDIAAVMDFLKESAVRSGIQPPERKTLAFHESFLKEIEKRGRVFEGGLMQSYMLRSGELFSKVKNGSIWEDVKMGQRLFFKGRLPLLPERIKGRREVRDLMKGQRGPSSK
ncbi:MAG: heterodisulfide reductase [Deltaproteobacteria bacterium]|nr:MAG: heterodisulfide reductase [Deltaproteobacteria bacterium]